MHCRFFDRKSIDRTDRKKDNIDGPLILIAGYARQVCDGEVGQDVLRGCSFGVLRFQHRQDTLAARCKALAYGASA